MITLTNKNWLLAINNLKKKDKILKKIISQYKSEKITSKKKLTYYVIFSLSIIFLINLNYLYNKKIISKYEIDNIYLTEWKDTKQILTYV